MWGNDMRNFARRRIAKSCCALTLWTLVARLPRDKRRRVGGSRALIMP